MNTLLVPRFGLVGAATGTTVAMGVGVIAAGLYLFRSFGACANLRSVISILISAAISYQIALIFPAAKISILIAKISAQAVVYFAILIIMREIGSREIRLIRKIAAI